MTFSKASITADAAVQNLTTGATGRMPASPTSMEIWIYGTIVVNAEGTLTIMGAQRRIGYGHLPGQQRAGSHPRGLSRRIDRIGFGCDT
ncbi:MAG: hypothetical protein IPP14_07805 [Planctomycetes bacterium]|nr:hypothetical protein [Planctomycetota bacterium]